MVWGLCLVGVAIGHERLVVSYCLVKGWPALHVFVRQVSRPLAEVEIDIPHRPLAPRD